MRDGIRIGPHPFWLWAVAPASGNGITGIGFMTKRRALRCKADIEERLPLPDFEPPLLLRRTGIRTCRDAE